MSGDLFSDLDRVNFSSEPQFSNTYGGGAGEVFSGLLPQSALREMMSCVDKDCYLPISCSRKLLEEKVC